MYRPWLIYFFLILFSFCFSVPGICQPADSLKAGYLLADTALPIQAPRTNAWDRVIAKSTNLNYAGKPAALYARTHKVDHKYLFFYLFAGILLLLGILKSVFSKYFDTLFRVFFNTSLRQSQLTDQLVQNKLASLLFNLFFVLSAGLYIFLLVQGFQLQVSENPWYSILLFTVLVASVYLVKYLALKFIGWATNTSAETNIYIFVVFLINKIAGVSLLAFSVIICFSASEIAQIAGIISLILMGILFLVRYVRAYSLLQQRLHLNLLHFLGYILSLELLPVLLVYKMIVYYLRINL
ncbi:MAG: DUF4271 domain-containing protein [Niastella sp.]|nr:DUF4271 domain-containing protein [Niastella sp.]